ncbi:MAG: response regulator [Anaerolineaceae bacterium]|nr:response regulator [Anaerolineaceae bacterium]
MNSPRTILNVEDIPENRHLVRRILESQGYRVVDAENALQGIEKALEIHPDLILMDINLPDLDGFTAVTRIRSYTQLVSIPILALTARNVHNDRERAKAIGCDGYLSKPIDFDELISQVARHIVAGHKEAEPATQREIYLKEQNVTLIEELEKKFNELKVAYDRLKHFEEAKSNFISVASHELRTPLTVIHSYTQMLQMLPAISADASAKELLEGVNKGVKRLQEIMNDMVSVIRVELADQNLKFGPVSVRSILKSLEVELKNNLADRDLQLEIDLTEDLPMVQGDAKQLHSALSRIINNAVKYTPDGGRISIKARLIKGKPIDENPFIEIIIADTGVGIEIAKQKLIFEKFGTAEDVALHSTSKTKFMGGGAGLGLTIAKGIIEAHEGRIWVESAGYDKDKLPGSKFFILLPTQ